MADVVQFRLERMVDELDDLERRGLFNAREIAEIVKKRRAFEYRLKRPCPLKQDFIAYIDYENHLESLRILRKKSVIREMKKTNHNKRWTRSISDFAGIRRILQIYRLAVLRYKGDIDLWFRYLEFCRQKRNGRMKEVLAQVIRFHPKVPGIWIYAAAWEFDQNMNVRAARALMQSGLRACPNSEDLWIEYLRMELTYLSKLKARKAALGEDISTLAQEHQDGIEMERKGENEDLYMPLNVEKEDNGSESEGQEHGTEKKVDAFREQGSNVFLTIFSGAVDALPKSMNLRKHFFEILEDTNLARSDELKEEIMTDMKKNFSREEEYWDWLGRFQIVDFKKGKEIMREDVVDQLNKAVQVYEEALSIIPSTKMFSLYARFWLDLISPERKDSQASWFSIISDNDVDLTSNLFKVYEKAESSGSLTEDLAHQYISFYLQLGMLEEARKQAEKLCNGQFSESAKLWVLRVSVEMKWLTGQSVSKDGLKSVFVLLQSVLTKLAVLEAESLWLMAIKFFSNQREYFDKLVQTFFTSIARSGDTEAGYSLSFAFLNRVLLRDGIQPAREMYKRFLSSPHPSLSIYRRCIELESNLAFAGSDDGLVNARKLYESALTIYSQDVGLWRDYFSLEIKVGTSNTVNAVHWRARKILKDRAGMMVSNKF